MDQNISKDKIKDIILFGARAKGNYQNNSDWDLLIITEKTFDIKEKMNIMKKINQNLSKLYIPCDILINSIEEIEEKKNKIGSVTKFAIKEGIKI